MKRILLLGNAGSGKSTLARQLGHFLQLPVIHLDRLYWEPGWSKPDRTKFLDQLTKHHSEPTWISDGNYEKRSFALRLARADLVIWMNTSRLTCMRRVLQRNIFERQRSDLPEGCQERINFDFLRFLHYVWTFDQEHRPRIEASLAVHGSRVPVLKLANAQEAAQWLATLEQP